MFILRLISNSQFNFVSSLWVFQKKLSSMKLSLDFENQKLKIAERSTLNSHYSVFLVVGSWEDRFRVWLKVISDFCVSSFFFFQSRISARLFLWRKISVSQWFPVPRRRQATLETTVSPQAFQRGLLITKQSIIRRVVGSWIQAPGEIGTGIQ